MDLYMCHDVTGNNGASEGVACVHNLSLISALRIEVR